MRCFLSLLARRASQAVVALNLCAVGGTAFAQDVAIPSGVALVDAVPIVIKDPHYGEALFYFHQGRFFTGATTLMTAQHLQRVRHQERDAEILRIGLLLSYGVHKEASKAIGQLGENGAPPAMRDRAELYLAKLLYQRGRLAEAEKAINRVKSELSPELDEERAVLKANLLMARQEYAAAANELEQVRIKRALAPHARFNLGVALIQSGREARGVELLDEIGKTPATSEESAVLRDKANLALGVASLRADRPENARGYLERVRLNGMLANMALLQFGWADAALRRPKAALVPWTELSVRTPVDGAVLEAKLAVPWAFAAMGEERQASDRYKDAMAIFELEKRYLNESIAAVRAGKLLAGLFERNPGDEMGWFWNIAQIPDMPHRWHVAQVLAQHPFQEAFKDYRDLAFLARNLDRWKEKLAALKAEAARAPQGGQASPGNFTDRVADAERRVQSMSARVAALLAEQQRYVQDLAVAALEGQKERLASYDRQARFAVEQIYERTRKGKGSAAAPR